MNSWSQMVKPAFAGKDKKQTMIDIRGISTNWFINYGTVMWLRCLLQIVWAPNGTHLSARYHFTGPKKTPREFQGPTPSHFPSSWICTHPKHYAWGCINSYKLSEGSISSFCALSQLKISFYNFRLKCRPSHVQKPLLFKYWTGGTDPSIFLSHPYQC